MSRYITASVEIDTRDVLDQIPDDHLKEELARRGCGPNERPARVEARIQDAMAEVEYEFDTLIHDLRASFLARDGQHFDVLLARLDGRYRDVLAQALAVARFEAA